MDFLVGGEFFVILRGERVYDCETRFRNRAMLTLLLIAVMCVSVWGVAIAPNRRNGDYLSRDTTAAVKGVFILLIILSHSMNYMTPNDGIDYQVFEGIIKKLGQLVVVMFLFYSGYGVACGVQRGGADYVRSIPRHRIGGTLVNFDIAVLVFALTGLALGKIYGVGQWLLSLVAWEGMGNSHWYIFTIVVCYAITYIACRLSRKAKSRVVLHFALAALYVVTISQVKEGVWYDTVMSYPAGFALGVYRERYEELMDRHYYKLLCGLLVLFVVLYAVKADYLALRYNALGVVFALLVLTLSRQLTLGNAVLRWCGTLLFPLYIYMRLPMLVLAERAAWLPAEYPWLFVMISATITVVIAALYKNWQIKL